MGDRAYRTRIAAAGALLTLVTGCGGAQGTAAGSTTAGTAQGTTLPRGTGTTGPAGPAGPTGTSTVTGPPAGAQTDPATAGGAPSAPDDATPGAVALLPAAALPDLVGYRYVRLRADAVPDSLIPLGALVSGFVSRGVAPRAGGSPVAEVEVFRLTAAGRTAARDTALLQQALAAFVPGATPRTERLAGTDVLVVDRAGGRPAGAAARAGGDVVVVLAPTGADVARTVVQAYVAAS